MMMMAHRCEVPYHATFVSDRNSDEFQVSPQTGVLPPPAAGPGAVITIGFTPHSYGRTCVTRLIIQVHSLFLHLYTFISLLTPSIYLCVYYSLVVLGRLLVLVLDLYLSTIFGYWYLYLYLHAKYWYLYWYLDCWYWYW